MEFMKTVMFLDIKRRVNEKGVTYVVNMFCPGGDAWEFYVKDSDANRDLVSYLLNASTGRMMDCTFKVSRFDRDTILRLVSAEDAA